MNRRRRILYVQYTNPGGYPPLEHSSQLLAEAGWEAVFLGTGAFGADALQMAARPGITVRQLEFQPAGWRQKLHYLAFCLWCAWHAMRLRPDWIYASDILACPAALLAALPGGTAILYHEHDAPVRGANPSRFLRMLFRLRSVCARRARLCVIPNRERALAFAAEHSPAEPAVVWNCPRLSEVSPPRPASDGRIRLLYHGSIVPERVPLELIDALKALPEIVTLILVGYETVGSAGYVSRLLARAEHNGVRHRIEYKGQLPRSELLAFCQTCDVGLSLLPGASGDANLSSLIGASNKAFEYLACGLPVITSAFPDWQEFIARNGLGAACSDSTSGSLASAIRTFSDDPVLMRQMGERGRQRILTEWNYERQFEPVWNVLHGKPLAAAAVFEQECSRSLS